MSETGPDAPRDEDERPSRTPDGGPAVPPDPEAYDHPRAELARAKGLKSPYIPGGHDPDPEAGRREERRLLRILLVMVVAVALSGFVLGALAMLVTGR